MSEIKSKINLSLLGEELGIQMKAPSVNGEGTEEKKTPPANPDEITSADDITKSDKENAKKTETKSDEEDATNDNNDNKDNKDNKVNENLNKYQLGGKYVEKTEVIKELDEKFKGKYDFSQLDDEAFELYYNFLKDVKDGENKKSWQKSMGERENELASEKKKIAQQLTDLQQKEAEYRAEVKRLKEIVEEDVEEDEDLTETERIRKITAQERAESRLIDLEKENKQNENARIKLQFYKDHNDLAGKYPELNTSLHIQQVFDKYNSGEQVDAKDVKTAYTVFKIVNDAIDYGMDVVKYYEIFKDNYQLPVGPSGNGTLGKGEPTLTRQQQQTAAELEALKARAEEIKKKQENTPGLPPGGKTVDPNPAQPGGLITGKTEKQKLNSIYAGKPMSR